MRLRLLALALAVVLVAAGCGGDGDDDVDAGPAADQVTDTTAAGDDADEPEASGDADSEAPPPPEVPAQPLELTEAQTICVAPGTLAFSATAPDGTPIERPELAIGQALATSPSPGQTWLVFIDQPYDFLTFGEKAPGTLTIVFKLTTPPDDPFASGSYTSGAGEVEVQWTVDADATTFTAEQLGDAAEVVVEAAPAGALCGQATVAYTDPATGASLTIDAPVAAPLEAWVQ